jgi:ATP-dependent Lon protease
MAVALASLATGRAVRRDVGMTGEITLRGKVLPIGGLKEKVMAAHRAGLQRVILPRRNEPDLEDVPAEIKDQMKFILADTLDDVLKASLEPAGKPSAARTPRARPASPTARPARGAKPRGRS